MGIVQKSESKSKSEKINLELLDLLASPQVKIHIPCYSMLQGQAEPFGGHLVLKYLAIIVPDDDLWDIYGTLLKMLFARYMKLI